MNKRYENIKKMNDILLRLEGILSKAETLLEEWNAIQPEYEALEAYYDSPQWREDYFDSKNGKISDEVPQWVLTQDASFDAIGTQFDLADSFQPLLERINARKWQE